MATFKFGRYIDIHWNGYDITGPAETVFSIPDQLYEEFDGDIAPVEPTLVWIDTNEFLTLKNSVPSGTYVKATIGTSPISVSTSSQTATISLSSGTASNGYLLVSDGAGGTIWNPASTSSLTSIVGISPISSAISGGTVSVSLTASYSTSTHTHAYIPLSTVTAKGNIIAGSTASTVVPLSVGTDGQILSASSGAASGLSWIDQSAVTSDNAARIRTYVRNATASTIAKGSVVYLVGSNGTVPSVEKALANADATSSRTFGIVEADIASNSNGYVTNQGLLSPLDTSGIADGAVLWLSPTIAGAFTTVKPAGPNHGVLVGVVVKGTSVGAGSIYVLIKNGTELDEVHDVNITSVANGQSLIYSSSASVWQNQVLPVASVTGSSPVSASTTTATGAVSLSIVAASIDSTHLSAGSVGSSQIIDGAVASAELATGAVTSAKIAASAVTSGHIASASIDTSKINSGAALANYALLANGSGAASFLPIAAISVSSFTANGTYTVPTGANFVYVYAVGGGGSGMGAGEGVGGTGGAGGGVAWRYFRSVDLASSTYSVVIASGGASVAGVSTATAPTANSGGSTTFGTNLLVANGGTGSGSSSGVSTPGRVGVCTSTTSNTVVVDGASPVSNSSSGNNAANALYGPAGGASGGTGTNTVGATGGSGFGKYDMTLSSGGSAGAAGGVGAGGAGGNGTGFGDGGGSGGTSTNSTGFAGGNGGNGAFPGGGGGGGGATRVTSTANGGSGGAGGGGWCLVIAG